MKIDCQEAWKALSAYLDGYIDPVLRAQIERHVQFCEVCSAVLDSTRNILYLTADDRVFELPGNFSERLHARIDEVLQREAP
jgi:predicted anti-sigma-YlaC factor YlaD